MTAKSRWLPDKRPKARRGEGFKYLGPVICSQGQKQMSLVVSKPAFCICENKDADQLRCNCAADQRLCYRHTYSTTPLLPKSEISRIYPSSLAVQPGSCRTWSETLKTGFPTTRLKLSRHQPLYAATRIHILSLRLSRYRRSSN